MKAAYATRSTDLKAAWLITTSTKARRTAIRAAWNKFETTRKNAKKTFNASRKTSWDTFNKARKACKGSFYDDQHDRGSDFVS
jgi:SH3-like domain-containing protein